MIHYVERTWWLPVVRNCLLETIAIPAKLPNRVEVLQ